MCRDCEIDSTVDLSRPIVRRAIASLVLALVGFVGVDFLLTYLFTAVPRIALLAHARGWVISHATAIDLVAGYALTAWPYGLKVTSRFGMPRGYIVPISWCYRLFEWRVFGGLFLGVFVFPFEVFDDIRAYRALRGLLSLTTRVPDYVDDGPRSEPRRVGSGRVSREELPRRRRSELPTSYAGDDVIDQ